MRLIDTHSHLFLEEFSEDLPQVIERARSAGVTHIFMPNIDSTTIDSMLSVCNTYNDYCFPMIGLHPTSVNADYEKELEIVALEYDLPVVIHCRDAFGYIYNVLEPYKNTSLKGVFHSFTGTDDEAARILEFSGFLIGINGVVTFKKSRLPEVLTKIPLEKIVLETDSPYLTPVPNRGKRNESAYVKDTLMKVSDIYRMSPEAVGRVTSENALKVFGMLK